MTNLKSNNLHHEFYPTDFALVDTTARSAEQREKHRGKEKEEEKDQMKGREKVSKKYMERRKQRKHEVEK